MLVPNPVFAGTAVVTGVAIAWSGSGAPVICCDVVGAAFVGSGVGTVAPAGDCAAAAGVGVELFIPGLLPGLATWFDPLWRAVITAFTGSVAPPVS